jgi:hypothetical protein
MANVVLFSWPLVAVLLFMRLGRERGLVWSVVVGYLFLPEAITFPLPGLPDYDKGLAVALGVVLGGLIFRNKPSFASGAALPEDPAPIIAPGAAHRAVRGRGPVLARQVPSVRAAPVGQGAASDARQGAAATVGGSYRPGGRGALVLGCLFLATLLVSTVMTMLTNGDVIVQGSSVRPGLTPRDVVSMVSEPLIMMVPLVFALAFLRSRSAQMEVARAIVMMGVIYAFLAAFEARMSPQLNIWIYGYFQHSWIQHLRDGFRPIVFLRHGLWVGFFLLTATMAAFALFRHTEGPTRLLYLLAGLWIFAVLAISRNLGALMLALMFVPLVVFAPRFVQLRVTSAVVILFLVYPAVWQSQILPIDRFVEFVASISEDRAQTFQFRLDNEAGMLARAMERPYFGWGGWDRWRVFDEQGRDTTVADGIWIITLGERGWVGYIGFFGILTLPLLVLPWSVRNREPSHIIPALGLIMAANLVYMIPNSTLSPIGWLIIGTMAAFLRWHLVEGRPVQEDAEAPPQRQSVYTRFAHRTDQSPGAGVARDPRPGRDPLRASLRDAP